MRVWACGSIAGGGEAVRRKREAASVFRWCAGWSRCIAAASAFGTAPGNGTVVRITMPIDGQRDNAEAAEASTSPAALALAPPSDMIVLKDGMTVLREALAARPDRDFVVSAPARRPAAVRRAAPTRRAPAKKNKARLRRAAALQRGPKPLPGPGDSGAVGMRRHDRVERARPAGSPPSRAAFQSPGGRTAGGRCRRLPPAPLRRLRHPRRRCRH